MPLLKKCWVVKVELHDQVETPFRDRWRVFLDSSEAVSFARTLGFPMKSCTETPGVLTIYQDVNKFEIYCSELELRVVDKKEPDVLQMVIANGGVELRWAGEPPGKDLQGWYKSKTQARKAAKLIPDAVLQLPDETKP